MRQGREVFKLLEVDAHELYPEVCKHAHKLTLSQKVNGGQGKARQGWLRRKGRDKARRGEVR